MEINDVRFSTRIPSYSPIRHTEFKAMGNLLRESKLENINGGDRGVPNSGNAVPPIQSG
ncbi:hypothetical protein M378DRAFT_169276 [Amanita muscaria Koide BX008]|uniref:Uncharacterized protein n=1 Tax=Amanita muscaria (strain Koide BX008) TaxID=946122 RepID=A0A0C2S9M2_AMAMK|nr:hypothetical protein M378DRAFT_169276 [Amanita muscaria Koide BX008]